MTPTFTSVGAWTLIFSIFLGSGCSKQSKVRRHIARGEKNITTENFDLAEKEYTAALALLPDHPEALRQLGILCFTEGRFLPAYILLERAVKVAPDDLEARLAFGQLAFNLAKTTEARDAARKVLEKSPTNEFALLLLAESSATARDNEEARRIIAELRDVNKDSAGYHVALGALLLARRDAAGAEAEIRKALELDPKSSGAHAYLGAFYFNQGDVKSAKDAFKSAASLSPIRSPRRLKYVEFLLQNDGMEEAKRELAGITEKAPDFIPALALKMRLSFDEHRYTEAAAAAEKILSRDRTNHDALLQNAAVKLAQNDHEGAIVALKQMEKFYPNSPLVKYRLARVFVSKGDFAQAEENLRAAIQLSPTYDDALLLLAEIQIFKGNASAAIPALTQFVKRQPHIPRAYNLLGRAHQAQGNLDESLKMFRAFTDASPKSAEPHFLMAMVFTQLNRQAEARSSLEQALRISPDYWPALEALINFDLMEKKPAAALARVQPLLQKFPTSPTPRLLSAKIHFQEGDLTLAESDLLKALDLDANEQTAYLLLAKLYLRSNKGHQAVEALNTLAAKTNRAGVYMQVGVLQHTLKQYDAARAAYEKALEIDAKFLPALNNLAVLLSENLGQLDKADSLAKRAREIAPSDPIVADTVGWILFRKGQYENALPLLRSSADKLRLEPEARFHLAMVHYRLGNEQAARQVFQQFVALPPESPQKDEAHRFLSLLAINPATADPSVHAELEAQLKRDGTDPVVLTKVAAIEARTGAVSQAAAHYETALALIPNSAPTLLALAQLNAGPLKNPTRARELGKKAYAAAPHDTEVALSLAQIAFAMRDYPWALTLMQAATQALSSSSQPVILFDLARAQYGVGRLPETEQSLKQVLEGSPPPPIRGEAQRLAMLISASKTPAQAQGTLPEARKILTGEPDYIPALMVSAMAAESQGDYQGAKQTYDKILQQNPTFAPAMRRLGILFGDHLGNDKKAEEWLTNARPTFPEDPELAYSLGTLNYRRGDFTAAVRFLSQSSRQRNKHADTAFYLGMSNYQLKNLPEARTQLQRALQLTLGPIETNEATRVLEELNKMPAGR
ncbi:MAG: tetratricopeptide repeat protein [Opitutaceae bacterium]